MSNLNALVALNQRVWYVLGGVHPTRAPQFLALGKFSDDPTKTIGEDTKISAPDPNNFNNDISVGTVPGEESRATLAIGSRSTAMKSILLDWANRRCRVDIFALSGKCGNPQDFSEGGEKWVYFPDGRITDHGYENFGAYGKDENSPTNEAVSMTSETYYEFLYMRQDQIGSASTVRELYTVNTYAGNNCETCPDPSQYVMISMAGASATPGTQPTLLYSSDGGETFSSQTISTLFSNENIVGSVLLGGYLILASQTANELHWTDVDELYGGSNVWGQTNTGFVVGKNPTAITGSDVRHIWVAGQGGYIYFVSNFKVAAAVQDAGIATTQNLTAIHAKDSLNVLAVGDSNAVIFTSNGGVTWEAATGPAVIWVINMDFVSVCNCNRDYDGASLSISIPVCVSANYNSIGGNQGFGTNSAADDVPSQRFH